MTVSPPLRRFPVNLLEGGGRNQTGSGENVIFQQLFIKLPVVQVHTVPEFLVSKPNGHGQDGEVFREGLQNIRRGVGDNTDFFHIRFLLCFGVLSIVAESC